MASGHLIDKDHMPVAKDRQIDGFTGRSRQILQDWPTKGDDVAPRSRSQPLDFGAKAQPAPVGSRHHQPFLKKRLNDPLHGGARQGDGVGNLPKAQRVGAVAKRAQHGGGARDNLNPGGPLCLWYVHVRPYCPCLTPELTTM